ncbi:MAG: pilin [Burkholderiales bacterium]|nr:pilin [Burkholderiales bacterium]MCE7876171.1 prepilin-type N-terminal cleavage/methylation domain-containing protein [Betaproteobacteria bacterium PRO3]
MCCSPPRRFARGIAGGFTLIELMIVVAIVGILSAIAVPQYQVYTGKAQLGEAIQISVGLKAAVAEQFSIGTPFASINGGSGGIPDDVPSGAGQYVDSLGVVAGTIVAQMRSNGVSPCVTGAIVQLTPRAPPQVGDPITWTCSTNAACKPQTCG